MAGKNIRLSDDERVDWLRLIRSENIGPRTFHALVEHYGSAGAALDALPELARRGGAARSPRIASRADAERELTQSRALGASLIATCEPDYPPSLAAIADPPPLLAVRGNVAALARPTVGIVGSRNASAAGQKFAQALAHDLGAAGFVVASGLARGIDAAAHRNREVFAVPGSPLDPRAEGTNALLKQGATLVTEAADVVAVLKPMTGAGFAEQSEEDASPHVADAKSDQRNAIIGLLGPAPVSIDDLVRLSGAAPAVVRMVLLELEIAGRLGRHGNGLVSLT